MTFEENLERLENTVEQLESGELGLQESIDAFKKGIELKKACQKELEEARKTVEKLTDDGTEPVDL